MIDGEPSEKPMDDGKFLNEGGFVTGVLEDGKKKDGSPDPTKPQPVEHIVEIKGGKTKIIKQGYDWLEISTLGDMPQTKDEDHPPLYAKLYIERNVKNSNDKVYHGFIREKINSYAQNINVVGSALSAYDSDQKYPSCSNIAETICVANFCFKCRN